MWQAYEELDPFGNERGDMQAALIASTTRNVWIGKRDKAASVEDMMPDFGGLRRKWKEQQRRKEQRQARSAREQAEALAGALGVRMITTEGPTNGI